MAEALTTLVKLLIVHEIQEDASGAILFFQEGHQGRLALRDPSYETHLRVARRSQERRHPVGVSFADGQIITELIRADNDVPGQLWEDEAADFTHVLFQGHDGVFHVKPDHPDPSRIRTVLDEALRQKRRVWFIAGKPDLALLDVLPAGSADLAADEYAVAGAAHLAGDLVSFRGILHRLPRLNRIEQVAQFERIRLDEDGVAEEMTAQAEPIT